MNKALTGQGFVRDVAHHNEIKAKRQDGMGAFLRGCALFVITLALPAQAFAHASDSGIRLLLPTGYYLVGGTLAVAATVLIAAIMPARWVNALFRPCAAWKLAVPRIEVITSLAGAVIVMALIHTGFYGTHDPLENALPLTVWTFWWVALPLLCAIFGNLWALINPWSGILNLIGSRGFLKLPKTIGYIPATLLFLGFSWFELVSLSPEDPEGLAWVISAYIVFTFVAGAVFGWEEWSQRGECFSVFFRFIARLAPIQISREKGIVITRIGFPGFGVLHGPVITISGALFILLALATVSFDGLSKTFPWLGLIGVNPLEFPGRSGVVLPNTVGLVGAWTVLAGAFFICVMAGRWFARESDVPMAGRLALTILPISLAYHVSHYLTALLVNGQYLRATLQRALALEETEVTTSFLNTINDVEHIWQVQSGAIVLGHILAVLLAHASILAVTENAHTATKRGTPLAVLMVAYTAFGLWLLAAPTGA